MASFRFKQFTIEQENAAMRVNTDGVLLGAWMNLPEILFENESRSLTLLDIGTGTGVIALMAAQRLAAGYSVRKESSLPLEPIAYIDAVELHKPSWQDALNNFAASPWGDPNGCIRLQAVHAALQQLPEHFPDKKYDLIFSNPPYFIDSLKSPHSARSNARHTDTLSQNELIRCILQLLKPGGKMALILPTEEGERFLAKIEFLKRAATNRERSPVLHPVRICKVKTTAAKPPKRYLMEFISEEAECPVICTCEELPLLQNGNYTAIYKELTTSFYLNF